MIVLRLAIAAALGAITPAAIGAAQPFPALEKLPECGREGRAWSVCEVRRDFSSVLARERLGSAEATWWSEGDEFTVLARAAGSKVMLCCSIQAPMTRIGDTDLWALTVSHPRMAEAAIDVVIISDGFRPVGQWRGPLAPAPRPFVERLAGKLSEEEIVSTHLQASRRLTIYTPPDFREGARYPVAYVADGESVPSYAAVVEPLILSGELPSIVLVGVHSAQGNQRNQEYLLKRPGGEFQRHEAFFLQEVVPFAEAQFGASREPDRRLLAGKSNGGDWALDTALRNSSEFGQAAVFSPAGATAPGLEGTTELRLFLAAGLFERHNLELAEDLRKRALNLREPPVFRTAVAGHSDVMWREAFVDALLWAFSPAGTLDLGE